MYSTPDLSSEFHPQPKPNKKEKAKPKPIGVGKKTLEWDKEKKQLIEEFEKLEITKCEIGFDGCWKTTALGFAHLAKRRKLSIEDLGAVVLACNFCHDQVELLNAVRMRNILEAIIRERNNKHE